MKIAFAAVAAVAVDIGIVGIVVVAVVVAAVAVDMSMVGIVVVVA